MVEERVYCRYEGKHRQWRDRQRKGYLRESRVAMIMSHVKRRIRGESDQEVRRGKVK